MTTSFLQANSAQGSSNDKFSGFLVVLVWTRKCSCSAGNFDCTEFSDRLLPTVYEKIKKYQIPFMLKNFFLFYSY